jgi:hypothetical protein
MKLNLVRLTLSGSALCAAICAAIGAPAEAAIILSTNSYSENFDQPQLSATAVTGQWTGTTKAAVPGLSGWEATRASGTGTSMNYVLSDGSANSGAVYSLGTTNSTERALGVIASGSNVANFGVELTNNLSAAISSVNISFTGEFWRSSTTTQNVLTFGYIVGPAGSATYLLDPATTFASLDVIGPLPVAANGALDGNLPANQVAVGGTLNVSVPVGQSLYLRWQDVNDIGNDAALAIDNFKLDAVTIPEPATLALGGIALIGAVASRRRD